MSISRRQAMQSMALSVSALSGCASLSNQDPIFDAHCHIIDHRFPVIANQGYIPPHFPLDQYLQETKPLGVTSGAIVSGSFQGFDQTYLKAALKALGPQWVGVTLYPLTQSQVLTRNEYATLFAPHFKSCSNQAVQAGSCSQSASPWQRSQLLFRTWVFLYYHEDPSTMEPVF